MHAALATLRATKLAEFGPTLRDREIFLAAEGGESIESLARRFGLAERTVRNIVIAVRDRLARELVVWRRMTLERLLKKEERLRRLVRVALTGWQKPVTKTVVSACGVEHTTTRPGRAQVRNFAAAERIAVTLGGLELYLERRMAEEEAAEVERHEVSVVSWWRRVGRRKSLSGRRLRVPLFVRARSVRRSACDAFLVARPRFTSKSWVHRIGIPPPVAA